MPASQLAVVGGGGIKTAFAKFGGKKSDTGIPTSGDQLSFRSGARGSVQV